MATFGLADLSGIHPPPDKGEDSVGCRVGHEDKPNVLHPIGTGDKGGCELGAEEALLDSGPHCQWDQQQLVPGEEHFFIYI